MSKSEKDVIIKVYPKENRATVEGNSAEGMICLKARFPEVSVAKENSISGEEVNPLIVDIREKNLTYSFRLNDEEKSNS